MSAITGIFYRDGRKVNPDEIKKMNNCLLHRGPDGSSAWVSGPIAFGHQMLWTTQESLHEALPFHDEEISLVITADARIDNRKELAEELDIEDKEDVSDSYFILKSYEKWGETCSEHLLGDFAFAIYDEINDMLFCARDHMGVKPFYYYLDDNMFIFATEIKALFCVSGVPYELNEKRVAFYLMDIDDNKSTFYENIFSCSSAHSLTITQSEIKTRQYWTIDLESNITMESDEDYANAFRDIFSEAVNCRLRSAFPIGFELSGGLDSSSVVCMAKNILNKSETGHSRNIDTFSYVFDDFPKSDESYYINKVKDIGGINSHFIFGDNTNLLECMDVILWHQEQPFFTPFIVLLWKLYEKMHEKDKRIILSGLGGDAVVSYGTYYLRDLAVSFKWNKLINELKDHSKRTNKGFLNLFCKTIFFPLIPGYLKGTLSNNKKKLDILNKDFSKKIQAEKYLKEIYWDPLNEAKTGKKHHYHLLSTDNIYMLEMLNRSTSVFSIELRYPYLDKRLVEFCYAIPTEMKFKFGWSRYIQRIAMEGILPNENQWRPFKAGLESLYEKNFLLFNEDFLDEIICYNNKIIGEYVDLKKLGSIYQKFKQGTAGYDSFKIWFSSLLYLWLKESDIL